MAGLGHEQGSTLLDLRRRLLLPPASAESDTEITQHDMTDGYWENAMVLCGDVTR